MGAPRRMCIAALVLAASGCGHAAPKPSVPPVHGGFAGIYSDDVFFGNDAYRRATLARERAAGVTLIRQPFAWSDFEKSPARYDGFVAAAARAGIRILPVVLGPAPDAPPATGGMAPPSDVHAFARYAAQLAKRYGPGGSLWSQHRELPNVPIRSWQIWNEPNIRAFWASGPDPAAYARLLETASAAIRKVDPGAEIVTAGLPESHLGMPAQQFLEGVYRAGAKGSFDTVAVHAYAPSPQGVVSNVRRLLDVVARNRDGAKLRVTEFGWGTNGKQGPLTVRAQTQASYIAQTLQALKRDQGTLRLRGVVLFQWRDPKPFPGRRDIWPYYAGLLDASGRPKPALQAFEEAAKS